MIIKKIDGTVIELPNDTKIVSEECGLVYFGLFDTNLNYFKNIYVVIPVTQISIIVNETHINVDIEDVEKCISLKSKG